MFVTFNKEHRGTSELKGCIGSFAKQPLDRAIKELTISAASRDYRFPPITMEDLLDLKVSITILSEPEEYYDCEKDNHNLTKLLDLDVFYFFIT